MTAKFVLVTMDGEPFHSHLDTRSGQPVLVADSQHRVHGTFASENRTSAGTTILASPDLNQEIVLTDMIVSTDKVNSATVTVQWTDDTNTIRIFKGTATDAPINTAIAFAGRWRGWKDARIEMVTVNGVDATVAIGYYKIPEGATYAEWDADR